MATGWAAWQGCKPFDPWSLTVSFFTPHQIFCVLNSKFLGYGGLTGYNPNFGLPVSLPLVLPQLTNGLRSPLGGIFSLPYWPYPSPPMSPNNAFNATVMPSMTSTFTPQLGGFSFIHMRNLPYQASPKDISLFLQGQVSAVIKSRKYWYHFSHCFVRCVMGRRIFHLPGY